MRSERQARVLVAQDSWFASPPFNGIACPPVQTYRALETVLRRGATPLRNIHQIRQKAESFSMEISLFISAIETVAIDTNEMRNENAAYPARAEIRTKFQSELNETLVGPRGCAGG